MAAAGGVQSRRRAGGVKPLLLLLAAVVAAALRGATRGFVAAPRRAGMAATATAAETQEAASLALSPRRSLLGGLGASLLGVAAPGGASAAQRKSLIATFKVQLEGDDGGEGEVKVRLHPEWAPRGVRRFKELIRMGEFEDAAVFHVDDKTAHFGLPATPSIAPDFIKDDLVRTGNRRGTLSFSQNKQDGRINQLFFNTADNDDTLDRRGYAPIGEVLEGMDVVDRFYDGYGTRPSRFEAKHRGNEYLDEEFPKLSKITSVEIEA